MPPRDTRAYQKFSSGQIFSFSFSEILSNSADFKKSAAFSKDSTAEKILKSFQPANLLKASQKKIAGTGFEPMTFGL